MIELKGAVAVVTGAAYGIGRATAIALAREGADVVVADIVADEGRRTEADIRQAGGQARFVPTDVGSRASVEALIATTLEWQGRCDLLVSNAGIGCIGAPHEFSASDWEDVISINLYGSIWATRALLPHMLGRDSGHLCFVTSGAGFTGIGDRVPYCVSKYALVGLADSLNDYLANTGVTVSLVAPGAIGGPHADTTRIAGAESMPPERVEAIKQARRTEAATWPPPDWMATLIVDGLREGRYYIIQEGPGHEDWLGRDMRRKWADPEASMRRP